MQSTLNSTRTSVVDTLHALGEHSTAGFNHTAAALANAAQIVCLAVSLVALTISGLAMVLAVHARSPLPVKLQGRAR